jgi:hypothetical protein
VEFDNFWTDQVDLAQLAAVPTPTPGYQGVLQGEVLAHFLGERYYAVTHPMPPGTTFQQWYTDAHLNGGIPAENAYRGDVGLATTVAAITTLPPGNIIRDTFSDGTHQDLTFDAAFNVHVGPVTP